MSLLMGTDKVKDHMFADQILRQKQTVSDRKMTTASCYLALLRVAVLLLFESCKVIRTNCGNISQSQFYDCPLRLPFFLQTMAY